MTVAKGILFSWCDLEQAPNKMQNGKIWDENIQELIQLLHTAEVVHLFIRIEWLQSRCSIHKRKKAFQNELKKWPVKNQYSLYGGLLCSGI